MQTHADRQDGTITDRDSNDFLTDNYGMGVEGRKALNHDVLTGDKNFRDTFREMLGSVKIPFDECKKVLSESESIHLLLPRPLSFADDLAHCRH